MHIRASLLLFGVLRTESPQHIRIAYVRGCDKRPQSASSLLVSGKGVCFCPAGANVRWEPQAARVGALTSPAGLSSSLFCRHRRHLGFAQNNKFRENCRKAGELAHQSRGNSFCPAGANVRWDKLPTHTKKDTQCVSFFVFTSPVGALIASGQPHRRRARP